MKIPETEVRWHHLALAVFLTVILVLNVLLFVEFKANQFRSQVIQNTNNITAIIQVLQQKGIIQAPAQQPTVVEQPVPEKK